METFDEHERSAKVLVVDDTPHNVKLLADLLAVKGYAVATAVNGEEALAKVASERPDLVLLDVMMPGLSGYDVCRRIRADPATALLPVVLVTSLDPQQERVKGIEAGADDFLSKPINQAELFARVRSLLRVKSLQDEVRRQAEALKEWNAKLEQRVAEQVAEIERMGQLKRFFAPAVADAILHGRRTIDPRAASARDLLRVRRPARLHRLHRFRRARGSGIGAARISRRDGRAHRRVRRHGRPLRRRRHPRLLQRSVADSRRRAPRRRDGAADAGALSARCGRGGRSSATTSISASASRRASRRSVRSASRGASTIRRSAAWSISRTGSATRRAPVKC